MKAANSKGTQTKPSPPLSWVSNTPSRAKPKPKNWLPISPRKTRPREGEDLEIAQGQRDRRQPGAGQDRDSAGLAVEPVHEIERVGQSDEPEQRQRYAERTERDAAQARQSDPIEAEAECHYHGGRGRLHAEPQECRDRADVVHQADQRHDPPGRQRANQRGRQRADGRCGHLERTEAEGEGEHRADPTRPGRRRDMGGTVVRLVHDPQAHGGTSRHRRQAEQAGTVDQAVEKIERGTH
jgi:hypothetical protein